MKIQPNNSVLPATMGLEKITFEVSGDYPLGKNWLQKNTYQNMLDFLADISLNNVPEKQIFFSRTTQGNVQYSLRTGQYS